MYSDLYKKSLVNLTNWAVSIALVLFSCAMPTTAAIDRGNEASLFANLANDKNYDDLSVFRVKITLNTLNDIKRVTKTDAVFLTPVPTNAQQLPTQAMLLVTGAQLEWLARMHFVSEIADELAGLAQANAKTQPALMSALRPALMLVTSSRAKLPNEHQAQPEATNKAAQQSLVNALKTLDVSQKLALASLTSLDDDADGLTNTQEAWWCTNPLNANSDGDAQGWTDKQEVDALLNVKLSRTVRWGYGPPFGPPNAWPDFNGSDGNPATPTCNDGDYDTIPDYAEVFMVGSNPLKESTDNDKFDDGQELFGTTYCPSGVASCGYGAYPRIEYWNYIKAGMPNWVRPPGDNLFVAAFPVPEVSVQEGSWRVDRVTTITTQQGQMVQTGKTYGSEARRGQNTSIANQKTWNEWEEISQSIEQPLASRYKQSQLSIASVANKALGRKPGFKTSIIRGLDAAGDVLGADLGSANGIGQAVGAVAGSAICTATGVGTVALPICAMVGGIAGNFVGGLIGDAINGKNDDVQKQNVYPTLEQTKTSVYNISIGSDTTQLANSMNGIHYAINQQGQMLAQGLHNVSFSIDRQTAVLDQGLSNIANAILAPRLTETRTSGKSFGGSQTVTNEEYEEHALTEQNAFTTGENWSTAWATDSSHAANLVFTYTVRNVGTEYARELNGLIFSVYLNDELISTYPAHTQFANGKLENLFPSDAPITLRTNNIVLTLEQMKQIDLGGRFRVVVEDFSYGADELFYQDAVNGGVTIYVEDGVDDNNEAVDMYVIPSWQPESMEDVITRYFPTNYDSTGLINSIWTPEFDGINPPVFNEHFLSNVGWWNIYLTQPDVGNSTLKDISAQPGGSMLIRMNRDSDRDGYQDRVEMHYGTDKNDPNSHPTSEILAGYVVKRVGNAVTLTLALENSGTFDAYGIQATLYSPDASTTVIDNIVGGNGRVRPGRHVAVGSMIKAPVLSNWSGSTAKPYATGDYSGNDKTFIFTVTSQGTVGQGSTAMSWSDGTGNTGTVNLGATYHAPLPVSIREGLEVGFNTGYLASGNMFTVTALTPRDTLRYVINTDPNNPVSYTEPVVVVSYNDPQGNRKFVTPIKLNTLGQSLSPYSGQMLAPLQFDIRTSNAVTTSTPNTTSFAFNSPHPATIAGAKLYLDFIADGAKMLTISRTFDIVQGPNLQDMSWSTSQFSQTFDANKDNILIAYWTDSENNIIDTVARPLALFVPETTPKLAMSSADQTWNFGSVAQGTVMKRSFAFANVGLLDLNTYVAVPVGVSVSKSGIQKVGAADLVTYDISLNTSQMALGAFDQTITIRSSDPAQPNKTVRVQGIVTTGPADVAGRSERPWDVNFNPTGYAAGTWVNYSMPTDANPQNLHPMFVNNQALTNRYGTGTYATDFAAGTNSAADLFGDGRDGPSPASGNLDNANGFGTGIVNSGSAGSTSINVTDVYAVGRINPGDKVIIHQTQGSGAGCWEVNTASSDFTGTGTFNLQKPMQCNYTSGGNNHAQIQRIPQYSTCNVTGTVTPPTPWNGTWGGILAVMCKDGMTVSGSLNASGWGFNQGGRGRTGNTSPQIKQTGEGHLGYITDVDNGGCSQGTTQNYGSGGGHGTNCHVDSGGGGGNKFAGENGQSSLNQGGIGGQAVGNDDLTNMQFGGQGGGGSSNYGGVGGNGGAGGGVIYVAAKAINNIGNIASNGAVGQNGNTQNGTSQAGGGGSGGSIFLVADSASLSSNSIVAIGGSGGVGISGSYGGQGSVGRVRVAYCNNVSGSTNPSASTQKITCHIAEQTETPPYNTGRINIPNNLTNLTGIDINNEAKTAQTDTKIGFTNVSLDVPPLSAERNAAPAAIIGTGKYATDFAAGTAGADMFGDGRDGPMPASGNLDNANGFGTGVVNSGIAGSTSINVTDVYAVGRINPGDKVIIHQTQNGGSAGCWEVNTAVSDFTGSGTFNLQKPMQCSYASVGNNHAQIQRIPQYSTCNVTGTVTPPTPWNGTWGGILAVMCKDGMAVSGNLNADGWGFRGGLGGHDDSAWSGEGDESPSLHDSASQATNPPGNGGGFSHVSGAGGGNGTAGTSGGEGTVGDAGGTPDLSNMDLGGGGAGSGVSNNWRQGGNGGGIIFVSATQMTVTGSISSNGENGRNSLATEGRGSSGGAGGSILLRIARGNFGSNKVIANGGARGTGSPCCDNSGSGGLGRIKFEYCELPSGESYPAANRLLLSCHIAEQTETPPYNTGRINIPNNLTNLTKTDTDSRAKTAAADAETGLTKVSLDAPPPSVERNAAPTALIGTGKYATDFAAGTASADMFGDGRDGPMPASGNLAGANGMGDGIVNAGSAGSTTINVTYYYGTDWIKQGDKVLIHQTQGSGAGCWEVNTAVNNFVSSTANYVLQTPLKCNYSSSGSNKAQILRIPQYSTCNVTGTVTPLRAWNGTAGGILAVMCKDGLTLTGSLTANGGHGQTASNGNPAGGSGAGFRGGQGDAVNNDNYGQGFQGEGTAGPNWYRQESNGNGGGAGPGSPSTGNYGTGGGGGNGTAGQNGYSGGIGYGGQVSGDTTLTNISLGGGGGGSNDNPGNSIGSGGGGGGIIIALASTIQILGSITANGGNGGGSKWGAGGGGGGSILLRSRMMDVGSNRISANGGNPGNYGGYGGSGRIRGEYCESGSGTAVPSISLAKISCHIVEQTETSPYNNGRINVTNNASNPINITHGKRLVFASAGSQDTTLRVPAGMLREVYFTLAHSKAAGSNNVKLDVGANGINEWDYTYANNAYLGIDIDATQRTALRNAINTYWIAQGSPTTGFLDVPIRVTMSGAGQLMIGETAADTSSSKLRYVQADKNSYADFGITFNADQASTVSVDIGDNGSIDWSGNVAANTNTTMSGLAATINAYLANQYLPANVPIRFYVSTAANINVTSFSATPTAKPDLAMAAQDLNVQGGSALAANMAYARLDASQDTNAIYAIAESDVVTVSATIRNFGTDTLNGGVASFFAQQTGVGTVYLGSRFVSNIGPTYGNTVITLPFNTTGFTGTVPVWVQLDPTNRIGEVSETNNIATTTLTILTRPDLQVTALLPRGKASELEDDLMAGNTMTWTLAIRNDGQSLAKAHQVAVFDGNPNDGGQPISTLSIPDIAGGAVFSTTVAWVPTSRGQHRIFIQADKNYVVNESNKANNELVRVVHVGVAGGYDIDIGNTLSDTTYSSANGVGVVDIGQADVIGNCGTSAEQSYRRDPGGKLVYQFDHLVPSRFYHLDVVLSECNQNAGRQELIKVNGVLLSGPHDLGGGHVRRLSFLLDPALYANRSISVTVEENNGLGAMASVIAIRDVDYRYADSGGTNDPAYPSSQNYGWLGSSATSTTCGNLPSQSVRVDQAGNELQYRFDGLNTNKQYKINLGFYQCSTANVQQQIRIDGQAVGSELLMPPNQIFTTSRSVPIGSYNSDGSIVVSIVRTNAGSGVSIAEISLEEDTQNTATLCTSAISPNSALLYGEVKIDGQAAPIGTLIQAEDPRGNTVGCFTVTDAGSYGQMYVYGEEASSNTPGMRDGETILFKVNGLTAFSAPQTVWHDGTLSQTHLYLGGIQGQIIPLQPRTWQMISFNVEPPANGVKDVMQSINGQYCKVLTFNKAYDCKLPPQFQSLKEMHAGIGYWVYITNTTSVVLNVQGIPVSPTMPISLASGWNYLGYVPTMTLPITTALASIDGKYRRVINGLQAYDVSLPPLFNTLKFLSPGVGYMINMSEAVTLTYPAMNSLVSANVNAKQALRLDDIPNKCDVVKVTPNVSFIYGKLALNDEAASIGSYVEAVTPRGDVVGCFRVTEKGYYGLMPVYGEDDLTPPTAGYRKDEEIVLRVSGQRITTGIRFDADLSSHLYDVNVKSNIQTYIPTIKR